MLLLLFCNMQGQVTKSYILLPRKDLIFVKTFLWSEHKSNQKKEKREGGSCNADQRFWPSFKLQCSNRMSQYANYLINPHLLCCSCIILTISRTPSALTEKCSCNVQNI